jgi:hypothetical protein
VIDDLAVFARYAAGLPRFLRTPVGSAEAWRVLDERLRTRSTAFLTVLERAVYGHAASPYRALLLEAGVTLDDARRLVHEHGVEGALDRLHGLGVYVTLDEFKGRRPIERNGLTIPVRHEDFDSPLISAAFVGASGGSRGPRRRMMADFDHRAEQAIGQRLFMDLFEVGDRPIGLWRTAPPGGGVAGVLGFLKAGGRVERWFAPNELSLRPRFLKDTSLTAYTVLVARLCRQSFPYPEHVPVSDAVRIAAWLDEKRRLGMPAYFNAPASSAVRICLAAERHGLDVSGTLFRVGGEPYTEGKALAIERVGARAVASYGMAELGRIGTACPAGTATDDVHLMTGDLAVIQRQRVVGSDGFSVGALLFTALRSTAPKVMLNVESDDFATLEERQCGCRLGRLGLTLHAHGIRSYEKLTSAGMTFLGTDVIRLLDEVLPSRFGGGPTSYQLVEDEIDGLPRVTLVVDPAVGALDGSAVAEALLEGLAAGPAYRTMMVDVWRSGSILRVERREPSATRAGKILPLHVGDRL